MRRCRIESLGVSLPRRRLLAAGSVEHAVTAGRRCLAASRHTPGDVRVLINAGVHRDEHTCEPAMACYIQHRLGINIEFQGRPTVAFDLANGGVGMLNAAHVLQALISSGDAHAGMVVASEVNPDRNPDPEYPYPASGAALLLDPSPRAGTGFGVFVFETREQHAGLYSSVVSLQERRGRIVFRRRQAELENAYLEAAGAAVEAVLEASGTRREALDLVVPPQLSPLFLSHLPTAIGIPRDKVADYTAELPDTLSTSTFLALHLAVAKGLAAPGRKALLLACGSGITVGAAIYDF
jgi:3-oxoacyl-[acyl-carrier-protein] synthase III